MARYSNTWRGPKQNKYGNSKVEYDGHTFDSSKELRRYQQLKYLEAAGEIKDLQMQVEYVLIPSQFEVVGHTKAGKEKTKCIERKCSYYADFVYTDISTNETVVEDTKGMRTTEYIIKRKLMLYIHGIKIKEI